MDKSWKYFWKTMEKLGKWKFGDSLKSYLNLLYLYLCLNHHQMIYINSFSALLSSLWWFQIGIMWIYLVFPTVPFGIALALEVIQHDAYRKIFGCACRIKKKLPILKVLTQARTPKIPRKQKRPNSKQTGKKLRSVSYRNNGQPE